MFIKITLRKQSEIQNYFGEQGNCTAPQMSPDRKTPKGKGWLKWTTNYPRPQMIPIILFARCWKLFSASLTLTDSSEGVEWGD